MNPMKPTRPLTRDERFFFDHAAWSHHPRKQTPEQGRTEGAVRLAEAEAAYWDANAYASVEFKCAPDYDRRDGDDEAPMFSMWIEDGDGHFLASLHGVDDDSTGYRRVVLAELASECIHILRELVAAEVAA